jgi:hypothetical protein
MKLSHAPDLLLPRRRGGRRVAEQPMQQRRQVEAAVNPIGKGAEVVAGVLAEIERLVRAIDHRLKVAQDRVDPLQLRQLERLALANNDVGVGAICVDDAWL